jgi:hypothetical protein
MLTLLALLAAGHAGTATVTHTLGDRDGLGIGLLPGDFYPDMNDFTPGPDDPATMDRMLMATSFLPGPAGQPLVTSPWATTPSPMEFAYPALAPTATVDAITLTFITADIDDAISPVIDLQLYVDGIEEPGAFNAVSQTPTGVGGQVGVVTFHLDPGVYGAAVRDGVLDVLIDDLVLRITDPNYAEAFGLDFAELTLTYTCTGVERRGNGVDDDCDGIVDEGLTLTVSGAAGGPVVLQVSDALPGERVYFGVGAPGTTNVRLCPGQPLGIARPTLLGTIVADAAGMATLTGRPAATLAGQTFGFQAAQVAPPPCNLSGVVVHRL